MCNQIPQNNQKNHKELVSEKHPEINEYLDKRKTTKKEIAFFKIGYASKKNNFNEYLKKEHDDG